MPGLEKIRTIFKLAIFDFLRKSDNFKGDNFSIPTVRGLH